MTRVVQSPVAEAAVSGGNGAGSPSVLSPEARRHHAHRVAHFVRENRSGAALPSVVLLGDSLVEGYRGPLWFTNRGIRSDHVRDGGFDLFSRLTPDKLAAHITQLFLLIGINDLADDPSAVPRILQDYEHLLAELKRLYPSARLHCISLLPARGPHRQLNPAIVEFNAGLSELARRSGVGFVDAHLFLRDERGELAERYSRDGLHLSLDGDLALTRALEAAAPGIWPTRPRHLDWPHRGVHLLRRAAQALKSSRSTSPEEGEALAGSSEEDTYRSPVEVMGVQAAADFLWLWLKTGDSACADLYRGICISELSSKRDDAPREWRSRTLAMLAAVDQRYGLSEAQWQRLAAFLDEVHAALPVQRKGLRTVRVLFVGDCLFEEVALFLAAECVKDGLLLKAEHVVSRHPLEQQRQLKALPAEKFAAVFYSPFTYSFHPDFAQVLELSEATASEASVRAMTDAARQGVARMIDALGDTFECPIFVSNTSAIQRGTTLLRRVVKSAVTSRTRRLARSQVNAWLPTYLDERNRSTHRHFFLLDEASLAPDDAHQEKLGEYLHTASGLHPTRFSQRLAQAVAEHVQAVTLCTRKLVICDLDNTLWEGVIGEGLGVRHHLDRQGVLRRLKDKGVILAIASKNDPAKVTWDGGDLDAACFVASEISWAPKIQGIQRIYEDLNVKPKDGVFIDDRSDERAMALERWPEMYVADPCDARTWRVFSLWATLLDEEQEFDRTAMYQQREKREAATSSAQLAEEAAEMFSRLGLKATLKEADRAGLKRVSELINRTNQWNLAATRTTFREVEQWSSAPDHKILTVQIEDKFGSMGTTCVVVVRERPDTLEIPVFVLSCRVFGFGVETLVLEHLKRVANERFGRPSLRGYFTATDHNAPCQNMYPEHGFTREGESWVYAGGPSERALPSWFSLAGFRT